MDKRYDVAVFIGRFQPLHNAHVEALRHAGTIADTVIVIVGSAEQPRDLTNPFYETERLEQMLEPVCTRLANDTGAEYLLTQNHDTMYDHEAWVARTQDLVAECTRPVDRIAIVGLKKDASTTEYIEMFPQWEHVTYPHVDVMHASQIRDIFFHHDYNERFLQGACPKETLAFLASFRKSYDFEKLVSRRIFIDHYKKQFASLPYAPVFLTVDAVVCQSGHVLLVKRKAEPGAGQWALPGGFFDAANDVSTESAMLRELKEETQIDVPEKVLKGSITESKIFDAKNRSERGRTVTHAFKIRLTGGEWGLPKVKGSDDAELAMWVPFVDLKRRDLFEDHFDIISHFVKFQG